MGLNRVSNVGILYYFLIVLLGVANCSDSVKSPINFTYYHVAPSSNSSNFLGINELSFITYQNGHPTGMEYSARHIEVSPRLSDKPISEVVPMPLNLGTDNALTVSLIRKRDVMNQIITLPPNKKVVFVIVSENEQGFSRSKCWEGEWSSSKETKKVTTIIHNVKEGDSCRLALLENSTSMTDCKDVLEKISKKDMDFGKFCLDLPQKLEKNGIVTMWWRIGNVDHIRESVDSNSYREQALLSMNSYRWFEQYQNGNVHINHNVGKPLSEGQLSFLFGSDHDHHFEFFLSFQNYRYGAILMHDKVIFSEMLRRPMSLEKWDDKYLNLPEAFILTLKGNMLSCINRKSTPMDVLLAKNTKNISFSISPGTKATVGDHDLIVIMAQKKEPVTTFLDSVEKLLLGLSENTAKNMVDKFFMAAEIQTVKKPQTSSPTLKPSFLKDKHDENLQEITSNKHKPEHVPLSTAKKESSVPISNNTPIDFSMEIFQISDDSGDDSESSSDKYEEEEDKTKEQFPKGFDFTLEESDDDLSSSPKEGNLNDEVMRAFKKIKMKERRTKGNR